MTQYFVTPKKDSRKKRWEKVYGRTTLPIKYPKPHLACTQHWGETAVYYLDTTAVPEALLDRLASFEARRSGISYHEARLNVRREWLILAKGCRVEKRPYVPAGQLWQPAFPFLQQVQFRPAH